MSLNGLLVVQVGGDEMMQKRQDADNAFHASCGTGRMTCVGFGGRYWRHLVPENTHHGIALAFIVVGGSSAVGVDVVNVFYGQTTAFQCFLHSHEGTVALG